jgi:hypothetical protein
MIFLVAFRGACREHGAQISLTLRFIGCGCRGWDVASSHHLTETRLAGSGFIPALQPVAPACTLALMPLNSLGPVLVKPMCGCDVVQSHGARGEPSALS